MQTPEKRIADFISRIKEPVEAAVRSHPKLKLGVGIQSNRDIEFAATFFEGSATLDVLIKWDFPQKHEKPSTFCGADDLGMTVPLLGGAHAFAFAINWIDRRQEFETIPMKTSVARMPGHRNILSTTRDKSFSNLRAAATSSEDLFGFFKEIHRLSQRHFPELSLAKFEIENPLSKLTPCSLTALPAEDEIYDALRIEPDFPLALVKLEVETKFREPYWLLCGVDDRQNASVLNLDDWGVSTFDPNFLSFDRGNTGDPLWNHMLYAAHVREKGIEILREREPSAAAPGFGM